MIYHLFQNSVWKVVKIAKTSNLKSAVKSQTITTVEPPYFVSSCNFSQNMEALAAKEMDFPPKAFQS